MADPGRFQGPGGLVTLLDSPCGSMSQIARAPLPHPHHRRDELWLYLLDWARSYRCSAARLPIIGRRLVVICGLFEPGVRSQAGCARRLGRPMLLRIRIATVGSVIAAITLIEWPH